MRLTSFCRHSKNAPTSTENKPKAMSICPGHAACKLPSTSTLLRMTAYSATLSNRPDSTADTGVGPSACASGSQLCKGAKPTLVP